MPSLPSAEDFIASGYYFDVFDMRDGHVLKIPHSFGENLHYFRDIKEHNAVSAFMKTVLHQWVTMPNMRTMMQDTHLAKVPSVLLGNFVFGKHGRVKQDKVQLLDEFFVQHSTEHNIEALNMYVDFLVEMFKYGIHDITYKFGANYGYNTDGVMVCVDFNEVTFSKTKAKQLVKKKAWLESPDYTRMSPGPLKSHFAERMDTLLTPKVVERLWCEKC